MRRSHWLWALLLGAIAARFWLIATALLLDGPDRLADVVAMWSAASGALATPSGALPSPYEIATVTVWRMLPELEPRLVLLGTALAWALLSLCVPWISYRLVRGAGASAGASASARASRSEAALVAGLVAILAPLLGLVPPELMPTALAGPACALSFWATIRAVEKGSIGLAAVAGMAAAIAVSTDASAAPIVLAGLVVLAGAGRPRRLAGGFVLAGVAVLAAHSGGWGGDGLADSVAAVSSLARLGAMPSAAIAVFLLAALLLPVVLWRAWRAAWGPLLSGASVYVVALAAATLADVVFDSGLARAPNAYLVMALVPVSVWVAHAWVGLPGLRPQPGSPARVGPGWVLAVAALAVIVWAIYPSPRRQRLAAYDDNAVAVLTYEAGFPTAAQPTFERLAAAHLHLAQENLASIELDADRPRRALWHLRQALQDLRRNPQVARHVRSRTEAEYYNTLAVIAARLGLPQAGRAAAARALRLDPGKRAALFNYGVGLLENGDAEAAQEHFAEHSFWIGQLPGVPLLHAVAAQRAGDCGAALALLPFTGTTAGPRLRPLLFSATGSIDDVALQRGRRIETLPAYVDAGYARAVCLAQQGRVRVAAAELRDRLAAGQLTPGALADEHWQKAARGRLVSEVLPNIIVIMIDTLRADHVGAYGYARPTTPNLDRLAANGVRFANAYSVSSWTGPAVASLFTGLMPARHGFIEYTARMRADVPTLAEELTSLGYASAAFSANFVHVRPLRGVGRGFQEFHTLQKEGPGDQAVARIGGKSIRGYDAREVTQRVVRWLRERRRDSFLLYVHYLDPHAGYQPPARHRAVFTKGDFSGDSGASLAELTPLERDRAPIDAAGMQRLIDLYDGEIRFADEEIGRLVDHLDGLGYCDNCIVVVTADHGEEFQDHGHFFHGFTLYEEQLRVPLIMFGRGVWSFTPRTISDRVQLIDLFSTLVEMVGGRPPSDVDGVSLLPLIDPELGTYRRSTIRGELHPDPLVERGMHPRRHALAVLRGDSKVLLSPDGGKELYRLDRDPTEQADLAASQPALADRLLAGEDPPQPADPQAPAPELSDAHREQLRALGYLPPP